MRGTMPAERTVDLSESISQVVPPARVEESIEALATTRGNPIRVLVQP